MRKYIYIGLFFLLCVPRASAQFTLVSGTVTDSNAIPYACGTISAAIINSNGQSLYLNGVQFSPSPSATKLGCPTDPTTSRTPGAFLVQLADNTQIKCGSGASIVTCATQTQWLFTVNTTGTPPPLGTGPQFCTSQVTVSGPQFVLNLNTCPALSNVNTGGTTGGGATGAGAGAPGVNPANCSNCPDTFGPAQQLNTGIFASGQSSLTLHGTRAKQGDLILVGVSANNASAVTFSVSDTCLNTWNGITNLRLATAGENIELFYAFNVTFCPSDDITASFSAGSSTFASVTSTTLRFVDNSSNPLDGSATGSTTSTGTVTSGTFSTTNANDIIVSWSWANNFVTCVGLTVGTIGGSQATGLSTQTPLGPVAAGTNCPSTSIQYLITSATQTNITATATAQGNQSGILVAAFRRLATLPTATLNVAGNVKTAMTATWSNASTAITLGATDPQPSANCVFTPGVSQAENGDCGRVIYGTNQGNGSDGFMTANFLVIPQGIITSISGCPAACVLNVSNASTAANQTPLAGSGLTGFINWCTNDTDAIRAAWNNALASGINTFQVPQVRSCFDGPLWIRFVPQTALPNDLRDTRIVGQSTTGSVLVALPQFQFDPFFSGSTRALGLIYWDQAAGLLGNIVNSPVLQKFPNWPQLSDFTIWGGSDGRQYGYSKVNSTFFPPAAIYLQTGVARNFSCIGFFNFFGQSNTNEWPGIFSAGGYLENSISFGCAGVGLQLGTFGPTQFPTRVVGGVYGWNEGAGGLITTSTQNGSFIYSHQTSNAIFGTSDGGALGLQTVASCNSSFCSNVSVGSGAWQSHGDTFYGGIIQKGSGSWTTLDGSLISKLVAGTGSGLGGVNLSGGFLQATNSPIQALVQTGGTFWDNCGNTTNITGVQPYLDSAIGSITGGTIVGDCSQNTAVVAAGNLVLSAGWGTTASWTTGPTGYTKRLNGVFTASGTGQAANPTITYTFPDKLPANSTCAIQLLATTQVSPSAFPFSATLTTVSGVGTGCTFTFNGTPTAGATFTVAVTAGLT